MDQDNEHDAVWVYLVFNAGVVASFTGAAAHLDLPAARRAIAIPRR